MRPDLPPMRPPLVVHVHKFSGISGSENHLRLLLPALRSVGYRVRLLILEGERGCDPGYQSELEANGVEVDRLAIKADLDPLLVVRLVRYLRRERPALLHTHLIHADVHGALAALLVPDLALVSSKHNDDPFRRHWAVRPLEKWLARRACRVIAISEWIRRFTIEVTGANPEKVVAVHYGIPVAKTRRPSAIRQELGFAADERVILAVGRLVPQKGTATLLRAFEGVARRNGRARLVIAGDGPLRHELEKLAADTGCVDRIHFFGYRSDVRPLMQACTVLAHPAEWEGFGLVLLEAMSVGCPVVATRVSAIPEVVADGETGLLVPPHDVGALEAALMQLLDDDRLRQRLGEAAVRRVRERFTVEAMAAATADVYRRCGVVGDTV